MAVWAFPRSTEELRQLQLHTPKPCFLERTNHPVVEPVGPAAQGRGADDVVRWLQVVKGASTSETFGRPEILVNFHWYF